MLCKSIYNILIFITKNVMKNYVSNALKYCTVLCIYSVYTGADQGYY